jgi:hypothetical protein
LNLLQDDALAARATRHGIAPMQGRRYETMIDRANLAQGARAAAFSIDAGRGFNHNTPATPVGRNPGTTPGSSG